MDCITIVLMTLDIVAFAWLLWKLQKDRFKREYHLSDKRIYYTNLH